MNWWREKKIFPGKKRMKEIIIIITCCHNCVYKCVSVFGLIIYHWHFHRPCDFLRILSYHYNLEGFSLTSTGFLTPTFLLIKRISHMFKISFSTPNLNIFCAFLILPFQSLIPRNKLSVEMSSSMISDSTFLFKWKILVQGHWGSTRTGLWRQYCAQPRSKANRRRNYWARRKNAAYIDTTLFHKLL